MEHGGKHEELSWYLAAEGMEEDGWRDHSPSDVRQLFGKFAWTTDTTDVALTLAHADNDLIGNGLIPESMHHRSRQAIFTHPDQTENRSHLMALSASHWLSDSDRFSGTVYLRRTRTATLNGDGNDEYEDEYEQWEDDGFVGEAPESGVLNRTRTAQRAFGLALQWTHYVGAHQLAVGLAHDNTRASFHQSEQGGELTDSRGISTTEEEQQANSLLGRTRTSSLYATDTWSLTDDLQLTGSLRYNRTRVVNADRMGTRSMVTSPIAN